VTATTSALVGPLPQIRFQDGTREVYSPPRNTVDPRYKACTDHRRACDCREAESAEERQELMGALAEVRRLEAWASAVGKLHQRTPGNPWTRTDRCAECGTHWPCPTWKLTADADWMVGMVGRTYGGRFDS
jgi:hypothetical protein